MRINRVRYTRDGVRCSDWVFHGAVGNLVDGKNGCRIK